MFRFTTAIAAAAIVSPYATGDDVIWTSPFDGSFLDPAAWSTGAAPLFDDRAIFDHVGGRRVGIGADVWADQVIARTGNAVLELSGNVFTTLGVEPFDPNQMSLQVGSDTGDLGILELEGPGTFIGEAAVVGIDAGAVGFLQITSGATVELDTLSLSVWGGAGTLFITDGSQLTAGATVMSQDGSSSLGVAGGASVDLGPTFIGRGDDAVVNIEDGTIVCESVKVGELGGSGSVEITGADSSWYVDGLTDIGSTGDGTLLVDEDAFAHIGSSMVVSRGSGATGLVEVGATSAGTIWVDGGLFVGGAVGFGGPATVRIHTGGFVDVTSQVELYPEGRIEMRGGTLRANNLYQTSGGTVDWQNGLINLRAATVFADDQFAMYPEHTIPVGCTLEVDNVFDVSAPAPDGVAIDLGGGIMIASDAMYGSTAGTEGSTDISAGTLVITGDLALGGTTTSAGGTGGVRTTGGLIDVDGAITTWPSSMLIVEGPGRLTADHIDARGGAITEDAAQFIVSSDLMASSHDGLLVDGLDETRFDLRAGTQLSTTAGRIGTVGDGRGVVSLSDAGTRWDSSGEIAVGTIVGNAVEARLEILSAATVAAPAVDVAPDGMLVMADGRIEGDLELDGNFIASGVIDGNMSASWTATTTMALRGPAFLDSDMLAVENDMTLGGTLVLDASDPTLDVAIGDAFTIIFASTRLGAFAEILVVGNATPYHFDVSYVDETIEVRVTNPADINGDGVVDVADMLLLLGAWGVCDNQTGCIEDLNGDGTIDVADMLEMLGAWT